MLWKMKLNFLKKWNLKLWTSTEKRKYLGLFKVHSRYYHIHHLHIPAIIIPTISHTVSASPGPVQRLSHLLHHIPVLGLPEDSPHYFSSLSHFFHSRKFLSPIQNEINWEGTRNDSKGSVTMITTCPPRPYSSFKSPYDLFKTKNCSR